MNVAARALESDSVSIKTAVLFRNIPWNMLLIMMVIGVLLSAFGIIYLKDLNRRWYIQYQTNQQLHSQNEVEWGKLLLEESTWATQARIQELSQDKLNMIMPKSQDTHLIRVAAS